MKNLFQSATVILLSGFVVLTTQAQANFPTQAGFSSLYVFGDTLSATADPNAPGGPYYYGQRWSNGRVWVEVLAQRQGLTTNDIVNDSYYNHTSAALVKELNGFGAPKDVANDLFIVWVCNADTFDAATSQPPLSSAQWQAANNQSQANYLQIITSLYAKGVRYLILPNAVDLSEIPAFNAGTLAPVLQAGCVDYDARFSQTISRATALCPGLTIYAPDYYTLLNNVLTNAAAYGLTNVLSPKGFSIDAFDDFSITNLTLDGQGTNYIFWDRQDPTAMFHEIMADVAQQLVSPVQITGLTVLNGSNELDVANVPVGLNGFVDGSTVTNQVSGWTWMTVTNIISTNTTQSMFVIAPVLPSPAPASGSGGSGSINPNDPDPGATYFPPLNPAQFYRLHFPYAWSWP